MKASLKLVESNTNWCCYWERSSIINLLQTFQSIEDLGSQSIKVSQFLYSWRLKIEINLVENPLKNRAKMRYCNHQSLSYGRRLIGCLIDNDLSLTWEIWIPDSWHGLVTCKLITDENFCSKSNKRIQLFNKVVGIFREEKQWNCPQIWIELRMTESGISQFPHV